MKAFLCLVIFCTACSMVVQVDGQGDKTILEKFNRRVYAFNKGLEHSLVHPLCIFYDKFLLFSMKKNIDNFYNNTSDCQNIFVNIFICNLYNSYYSLIRCFFNCKFYGFLDLANMLDYRYDYNNSKIKNIFGWYNSCDYMMLPFIGASTVKGNLSLFILNNPFYVFLNPCIDLFDNILFYHFVGLINEKSSLMFDNDFFDKNMIDGYSFVKSSFIQYINYLFNEINDNFLNEPDC